MSTGLFDNFGKTLSQVIPLKNYGADIKTGIMLVKDLVAETYSFVEKKFISWFGNGDKLAELQVVVDPIQTNAADRPGIVVLPSANDSGVNDQVKEYVTNSFSDDIEIIEDESGNSGLIRPIFKNESDQEYLYVIVPVKEDKN